MSRVEVHQESLQELARGERENHKIFDCFPESLFTPKDLSKDLQRRTNPTQNWPPIAVHHGLYGQKSHFLVCEKRLLQIVLIPTGNDSTERAPIFFLHYVCIKFR